MLKTQRLWLRPAQPSDHDALHEVYGNADAMRYWDTLPDADLKMTARRVNWMRHQTPPISYFVIDMDGTAIGNAGVHEGCELGFILNPAHWRKGLMAEALTMLIPHLFSQFDYDYLTADVDPENAASLALLARFGFVKTGSASRTVRLGDRWCDSVYLRLNRP